MSASIKVGESAHGYAHLRLYLTNSRAQGPNWAPPTTASLLDVIRAYDPIINTLYNSSYWAIEGPLTSFPLSLAGGINSIILSNPPDFSPPGTDQYDETFYASTLHGISSLVSILGTGRPPILPGHSGEKFCRHTTFKGSASYPSLPLTPPSTTTVISAMFSGPNVPSVSNKRLVTQYKCDGYYLATKVLRIYAEGSCKNDFASAVLDLSTRSSFTFGGGTQFWRVYGTITDVVYDHNELSFFEDVTCAFVPPYFPYTACTYKWRLYFHYRFDDGSAAILPRTIGSDSGGWSALYPPTLEVRSASCDLASRSVSIPPSSSFQFYKDLEFIPETYSVAGAFSGLDYGNKPSPYALASSMRQAVEPYWRDVIPSCLFSATDALLSIEGGTATDVLQSLYKLPGYQAMIPKIGEAIDLLSRLARKDLSGATAKEIVDLASTTMLQGSFQWRPLLQLVTTELPKIIANLASLRSERHIVVGRGEYEFNFVSGTFGRPASSLKTRSKIVLDLSARALASSLLGADSFGVLPKASNLWDLLPFTFVVNWFTGVGPALKRVEYATLMSTIPAYYVHTYTITSPFTVSETSNWSMASDEYNPLSIKLFYRDVSLFSPLPRDSRFGFGIPTRLPPIGAAGALLWQILT